ncbi:MAG: hypothetical protein AB4042_11255 [Leptolyngbyaceae cyanobacterium]
MAEIQIAIEGAGAAAAAAELFGLEEMDGSYQLSDAVSKDGTVAVIGTVVGITVGAMTIGEKLHKWYQGYRAKDQGQRIEKVLIVTPTSRLLFEDATIEEIAAALKPLAK